MNIKAIKNNIKAIRINIKAIRINIEELQRIRKLSILISVIKMDYLNLLLK